MAGSFYIWIMGAFFLLTALVVATLVGMMWIGHWAEKKETGAKHGFLELPENLHSAPLPTSPAPPATAPDKASIPKENPPSQ